MHYYQHHIGDYMRDTAHLSLIEDAIYRRLLDYYYLHEKPLPENVAYVARMIRASDNIEQVGQMLNEYFQLTKNGWEQKRCNLEIREYGLICERNKANGKQGGRPKKTQSVNSGLPDETQTKANHEPLTMNHEPKERKPLSGKPDAYKLNGEAKIAAKRLLIVLNEKTGRSYRPVDANLNMIIARLREYTEQELRGVIVDKAEQWLTDEKMVKYLRPATLFAAKNCAQYIGELPQ